MSNEKQVEPKYVFAADADENLPPVKRKVLKTMETTEEFTVYSVFEYLAKMDKAISDKIAEVDGLKNMREAYMKELSVIERQLDIEDLEDEFRKVEAEKATEDANKEN